MVKPAEVSKKLIICMVLDPSCRQDDNTCLELETPDNHIIFYF